VQVRKRGEKRCRARQGQRAAVSAESVGCGRKSGGRARKADRQAQ